MVSFLEYWVFLLRFFCTEQLYCSCRIIFSMFLGKKNTTQTGHFAWVIDLPKWLIFRIVSFLEYWVFSPAVCFTEQLYFCCMKEVLYEVRCLKSTEDMILASNQLSYEVTQLSARIISSLRHSFHGKT